MSNLPGAVGRMQAFGAGPLLLGTAGLLLICLLRTPLRWSGTILVFAAGLWAVLTPRPDVLIAGDGQAAAFRGPNGRLSVLHSGRDSFAIKEWLAADADARQPKDPTLGDGVNCDAIGCIGRLSDGRLISMVLGPEAFAEDCACRGGRQLAGGGIAELCGHLGRPECLARRRCGDATLESRSV